MSGEPRKLDDQLEQEIARAFDGLSTEDMMAASCEAPRAVRPDADGRVAGRIVRVSGDDVFVDVGGKSEGVISRREFPPERPPSVGEQMRFKPHGIDRESGLLKLSLRDVVVSADWDALNVGDVVEGKVTGVNKGGLELRIHGMRAFMPAGQVDMRRLDDFSRLLQRTVECEILEIKRNEKSLIVSRKKVQERQREEAARQVRYTLEEGQVRKGIVRNIVDYGAFVDLGGMDGLLHISDMSHRRIKHPSEVVKEGEAIDVQVLKIDLVKDRISLGLKQLQTDPWTMAAANYKPSDLVSGKVAKLMDFGAFVELEPGLEALIPISEMTHTRRIHHPRELLQEGQDVQAQVLEVDPERRRMSLSLKRLEQDPWTNVAERYKPDDEVSGLVVRLADFGAFIQLEEGVEGLVHISQLADHHVRHVSDVVKEGEVVKVRVLSVDAEQRRISLSMKPANRAGPGPEQAEAARPQKPRKRKRPLRGGLD